MATKYYYGAAVPVVDKKYFTFTGTWASTETAYIEINGKRLTMTLTATMTIDQMCQAMAAMLTGAAAVNGEVRDALGTDIGEFALLTVSYSTASDYVLLEGRSDGRPIGTVTVGDTAASGAFASGGGTDQTGTGPHDWSNVDNWSGGAVPVASDTIIFDHEAAAGPKYNITLAYAPDVIQVTDGFQHTIGLPAVNKILNSRPFNEPNAQYASFTSCADVRINAIKAGNIRLDFGSAASTIVVDGTGQTSEANVPALLLKGNHSSNAVTVNDGNVGYCHEAGTTGAIGTLVLGGQAAPVFEAGTGVTITTLTMDSGRATIRTAATTINLNGGELSQLGGNIGATTVNINGGTFFPRTVGTYATVTHSGGTIDCTRDARSARTFTNYYLYGGGLKDPSGTITFTNGIRTYTKLANLKLDLPAIKKYTLGAV